MREMEKFFVDLGIDVEKLQRQGCIVWVKVYRGWELCTVSA